MVGTQAGDEKRARWTWLVGAAVIGGAIVLGLNWETLTAPWVSAPEAFVEGGGAAAAVAKFCGELSAELQRLSWVQLAIGWAVLVCGTGVGLLGGILGPVADGETSRWPKSLQRTRGLLLIAAGGILATGAMQILDRAATAADAAAQATLAYTEIHKDNREAYDQCVRARVFWLMARKDQSRTQQLLKLADPG